MSEKKAKWVRAARDLFRHRTSPNSATCQTPAELFLNGRLDLMHADVAIGGKGLDKQRDKKSRMDQSSKTWRTSSTSEIPSRWEQKWLCSTEWTSPGSCEGSLFYFPAVDLARTRHSVQLCMKRRLKFRLTDNYGFKGEWLWITANLKGYTIQGINCGCPAPEEFQLIQMSLLFER